MGVLATVRSGELRQETHDLLEELGARGARRLEPGPLDTSALGRILARAVSTRRLDATLGPKRSHSS